MSESIYLAWAKWPQAPRPQASELRHMAHALRDALIEQVTGCERVNIHVHQADSSSKPQLLRPANWQFNLSHSRDAAAVVLAQQPVGVDLEYLDRPAHWPAIAERLFHPSEQRQLEALPAADYQQAAVKLWTAKEAWSKAAGLGVAGFTRAPAFSWDGQCWLGASAAGLQQLMLAPGLWLSLMLPSHTPASIRAFKGKLDPVNMTTAMALHSYEIIAS